MPSPKDCWKRARPRILPGAWLACSRWMERSASPACPAQARATVMNPSDPWERLLVAGLARDFQQMRFEFLRQLAPGQAGQADPLTFIEEWTQSREAAIRHFRAMIGRAQAATPLSPTMLAQIASQARNLLHR